MIGFGKGADAEHEARWRAWQLEGAAADRRRSKIAGVVALVAALALGTSLVVQLFIR